MSQMEAASYDVTRFNALRHGVLSRFTLLPWEDAEEYAPVQFSRSLSEK